MKKASSRFLVLLLAVLMSGPVAAQRKAVALAQGTQLGKAMFPPGDTAKGGNGQTVDGIEALEREMLKTHFHSHLALFYRGEQIAIPYGIGIVQPFEAHDGFVDSAKAIYWIHTHDATGIIHVESPDGRRYTLGNFFDLTSISLPIPGSGLPAGLMLMARNGQDHRLFRVAAAIERLWA